ncbi:MAG: HigA family addiction module antidote protein [Lachnospiraceae bacterium]|nr:HigA family addiction module antidote protein [Lachnospiraceae bacterium]
MRTIVEHNDRLAFHPGYYIQEIQEELGLTQEDFAKRLDTTPKNLSLLIRGEQSLSIDMAVKIARYLGTSIELWLNLQRSYDCMLGEMKSEQMMKEEEKVSKLLDYDFFKTQYEMPPTLSYLEEGTKERKIEEMRRFLGLSSLTILEKRDIAVSFRSTEAELTKEDLVRANVMVQIAINRSLKAEAPKYLRKHLSEALPDILSLQGEPEACTGKIKEILRACGIIYQVIPEMEGAKISGATKKLGDHVLLMMNERCLKTNAFWFTLFHEIGHIMHGDYGMSIEGETGEKEEKANRFAEKMMKKRAEDLYQQEQFYEGLRMISDDFLAEGRP